MIAFDGREVVVTRHAAQRALDMMIDPQEIKLAIINPEEVSESKKYKGDRNLRHGRIRLGTAIDSQTGQLIVKTVVWAHIEGWQQDFEVAQYTDRDLRDRMGDR